MDSGWFSKPGLVQNSGAQSQLLFNVNMPPCVLNRSTRVSSPAPIMIEKLVPQQARQEEDVAESCSDSFNFSVLSEERLQAAVRLARKDLRQQRQNSLSSLLQEPMECPAPKSPEKKDNTDYKQNCSTPKGHAKMVNPKKQPKPSSQTCASSVQKPPVTFVCVQDPLSPNRDSGGPRTGSSEKSLLTEMRKLQQELDLYIQRILQSANKGVVLEAVEPEEKRRLEVRRQEQATRSARLLYSLQQQVKECQANVDKQSFRHTKKSRTVDRLAAAHRGAVRAMQLFVNQMSDPLEGGIPAQCKELGQLVRQLSLSSAKVEVDRGSAVPETTLQILQKLEALDSALRKQDIPKQREHPRTSSASPVRGRTAKTNSRSASPPRPPRAVGKKAPRGPQKPAAAKKNGLGRRMPARPERAVHFPKEVRSEVLKNGIQTLLHLRELKEGERQGRTEPASSLADPEKLKGGAIRDASFQQPTVSSKLRETHLPQKTACVPWIPTSPHSPPKERRFLSSRPEPRCLFSPGKSSSQPTVLQSGPGRSPGRGRSETQEGAAAADITRQSHDEAVRKAWLNRITEARRDLNQVRMEETENMSKLRPEAISPTRWTERAQQSARKRLQPLLDQTQAGEVRSRNRPFAASQKSGGEVAANGDPRVRAALDDLLEDGPLESGDESRTSSRLQDSMLEHMLRRMEEMEKDEEEVRRRFAMISYSDPLLWERDTGVQRRGDDNCMPASPQVIRLTKAPLRPSPMGDIIIMQGPAETGTPSESPAAAEDPSEPVPPPQISRQRAGKTGGIRLTVPSVGLKHIAKHRQERDAYLRLASLEPVGNFDPWNIAESLAEELLEEALADVATEFQNACEEYTEAVFTSEFLKPVLSPPPPLNPALPPSFVS